MAPRCDCACRSIRNANSASPSPVRVSASSGLVTQTRLERRPGRGTSVNGPCRVWNSVDGLAMRALMSEKGRDGRLRIRPPLGSDPDALPKLGIAPVGRPRTSFARSTSPPSRLMTATPSSLVIARRLAVDESQSFLPARGVCKHFHQIGILDVPAEGIEADLGRPKRHRRRTEEAPGIVDDAHGLQRRRAGSKRVPEAQRFEETDRAVEKRHGPSVPARFQTADQRCAVAIARESERGAEPDRAGTDDRDVEITPCLGVTIRHAILFGQVRRSPIVCLQTHHIRCIRHCR